MRKILKLAPVLIGLAFMASSNATNAATIFTGKGGATCTFENCMAYCKKVGGVQCTRYCDKVIPERHRDGTCK